MAHTLRDGTTTEDPRLDRIVEFDPRSLDYRIRGALDPDQQQQPVTKTWPIPDGTPVLDQGAEGACFTGDVLITMADGSHRQIEDVRLLDEVVTAEGRTGTVTALMVRPADHGLTVVGIEGHIPLRCTPQHPVLTARGYVPAAGLVTGDLVAITRWAAGSDEPLRPRELVDIGDLRGTLSGEVNAGGVITRVAPLPELLARTPALGRLLGLYAAEGHATVNKVVWSFGGHERDTLVPETIALVKDVFDAEARIQIRANGAVNVVLYGKAWRRLFEALVPGTARHGDKRLSGHITAGPAEYRRALLEGWIAGDGYQRRTEITAVSVCRQLALDMHALATGLGMRPIVRSSAPSPNRHAATRQTRYDFAHGTGGGSRRSAPQDEHTVWRRVRTVTAEQFEGPVYNMEVEGEHSYVADGVGVHNCVGFSVTNELLFEPVPVPGLDATFARERIYWTAQRNDQQPGGSYPGARPRYEGAPLLWGVKAAASLGYYRTYRWATSEAEMAAGVSHLGPAIIGIDWHQGMERPDRNNMLHRTGRIVGGHATLLCGIDVERGVYILHNSWGERWADHGRALISRTDMARLLAANGECCIVTERAQPA